MAHKAPIWLVTNASSGGHNEQTLAHIATLFAEARRPIARRITLGEEPSPTGDEASAAGVGLVIIYGGDGTISSVARALDDWAGHILALPGGTMNLLARALHGDRPALELAGTAARESMFSAPIPVITAERFRALAGIVAGPTSAWGDVREHLRNTDLKGLASSVPGALSETLTGNAIAVEGVAEEYQAVYLQPAPGGVELRGIVAQQATDLIAHGWAWLAGDFRNGPNVQLGTYPNATLRSDGPVGLLVDGEKAEAGSILHIHGAFSPQRFLSRRGGIRWT